jgi:hypothetical protein
MQLNLGLTSPPDQQQPLSGQTAAETTIAVTPWHKLDPAVQADALQILARTIAAMLAAALTTESRHE